MIILICLTDDFAITFVFKTLQALIIRNVSARRFY